MDVLHLEQQAAREGDSMHDVVAGVVKSLWFALPSIVAKDSDGHTVTTNSAIKVAVTMPDGSVVTQQLPPLDTSPIHYPSGGGVSHTHPVKKNDEGLTIFTSRGHDNWHEKGGIQDQVDSRAHHLADSWHIPGGRSDPRRLDPPVSSTSQQNRSDDGNHVSDLHPQNGITHSSTVKHTVIVGGSGGSGTSHLASGNIVKNAMKVLINTIEQSPLPPPGSTFANKKLVATKPIGAIPGMSGSGGISSVMSSVLSGGIGTLLSNPAGAASASLGSAVASAASAVGGIAGAGGLVSALTGGGGLQSALTQLASVAGNLSGATMPATGSFGLADVLAHAQSVTSFFGATPPSSVSVGAVLGPVTSSGVLAATEAQLNSLTSSVVSGATPPAAATTQVDAMTAQLSAIVSASVTALTTLQAALPELTLALLVGSAAGSQDPNEAAVAAALSGPQLAALVAAVAEIVSVSAADAAALSSFPDATAEQPGATGGL